MTPVFAGLDALKAAAGREIGVSDWVEVTQERIDRFAETTGNFQWIHVDVERVPGVTLRHDHCPRTSDAPAGAAVHDIGAAPGRRARQPQ